MDDMERYGDYNEVAESPKSNNIFVTVVKIMIAFVCIAVAGILGFRITLFNYYPDSAKNLYFDSTLLSVYLLKGDDIEIKNQDLRFPYDDPDEGNFFAEHLYVIEEAGQLQIALRYNDSIFDTIEKKYGVRLEGDGKDLFTFRLARDPRINDTAQGEKVDEDTIGEVIAEPVGELAYVQTEEFMMYTYFKLVFNGIDFGSIQEPKVEWIRIEISINGVQMEEPYMILIYENNEAFSTFTEYKLSEGEIDKALSDWQVDVPTSLEGEK